MQEPLEVELQLLRRRHTRTPHSFYGLGLPITIWVDGHGARAQPTATPRRLSMIYKGAPRAWPRIRAQHRWRLERELDTASSGRSNGLLSVVVEIVVPEAAGQGRNAVKVHVSRDAC